MIVDFSHLLLNLPRPPSLFLPPLYPPPLPFLVSIVVSSSSSLSPPPPPPLLSPLLFVAVAAPRRRCTGKKQKRHTTTHTRARTHAHTGHLPSVPRLDDRGVPAHHGERLPHPPPGGHRHGRGTRGLNLLRHFIRRRRRGRSRSGSSSSRARH